MVTTEATNVTQEKYDYELFSAICSPIILLGVLREKLPEWSTQKIRKEFNRAVFFLQLVPSSHVSPPTLHRCKA